MKLFDVYPINDITITKGQGSYIWDENGVQYLDMYGGHAVISIGHTHPHWVKRIEGQLEKIAFYSNSVRIPIQQELADKLGKLSGKEDYQLFLCSSGAKGNEVSAIIVEGVQGVGGINVASESFLQLIRRLCDQNNAVFIADAVQDGYGRTGKFFSHDYAGVNADIYTLAKGMGNGFPVGGILITPHIQPKHGMLGTTFGGNHLACAAALAVLEAMEEEKLIDIAKQRGMYLMNRLKAIDDIENVRGRGLMIGFDVPAELKDLRKKLLYDFNIFTGEAKPNVIRLLPSLAITRKQVDEFLDALQEAIAELKAAPALKGEKEKSEV